MNTDKFPKTGETIGGYTISKILVCGHCPATYTPHDFIIAIADRDGVAYMVQFDRRTRNHFYKNNHGDAWHVSDCGYPFPSRDIARYEAMIGSYASDRAWGGYDNGHGEFVVCNG